MSVNEKIRDRLMPRAREIFVKDVRIGLGYTAVLLENGQAGVAFTIPEKVRRGCTVFEGLHPLAGRQASDLLAFLDSANTMETAVALATANALSNTMKDGLLEGDTLDHLSIASDDKVGMVGYFAPMVPRLRKRSSSLVIFEKVPWGQEELLPAEEVYRQLPQCQVALITSTSIVNHTVDALLNTSKACREVVLLGPSTPLLPEVFTDTPVTILSGIVITRPMEILRIVSEGGGVRFFKGNVRKVNLRLGS